MIGKRENSAKGIIFIHFVCFFLVVLSSPDCRVSFSRYTESLISLQLRKHSVALTAYCEHISAIPLSTHSLCKSIFLFAHRLFAAPSFVSFASGFQFAQCSQTKRKSMNKLRISRQLWSSSRATVGSRALEQKMRRKKCCNMNGSN